LFTIVDCRLQSFEHK